MIAVTSPGDRVTLKVGMTLGYPFTTLAPGSTIDSRIYSSSAAPEAPPPKYSAHRISYVPALSGCRYRVVYRPGTMSCLIRYAGTKKLWITSSEERMSITGLPAGPGD